MIFWLLFFAAIIRTDWGRESWFIFVGGHENRKWIDKAGLYSPKELIRLGFSFFTFASFWPCSIFKTNDALSLLREAYNYIPDSYVNMPLIFQYYLLNKNLYVHSSK